MKKFILAAMTLIPLIGYSKEVKIAVGLSLPPYFIESEKKGMEYEVIEKALAVKGHTFKAEFLPFARVPKALESKEVDGAATVNEGSGIKTNYTNSHITYQNFAISLKSKNLKIDKIADLSKVSVAAFQNAKAYLGEEFAKMANSNKDYAEHANQVFQNKLLYSSRVDVVIGDKNIFNFYNTDAAKDVNTKQEVVFHPIFPETNYKMGFTDPQIVADFNQGLEQIKKDGTYKSIIEKYSK